MSSQPPSLDGSSDSSGSQPTQRKLNKKKAGALIGVVVLVGAVIAIILVGPSVPNVLGCSAGTADATVVSHQSQAEDGTYRVAFQVTEFTNKTTEVTFDGPGRVAPSNISEVHHTAVVTGLSQGQTVTVQGENSCGSNSIQSVTVQ